MKSGDDLRKGISAFALLRPSLLDSFDTHGPGSKAELQGYSMVTGELSTGDESMNSGELLQCTPRDRGR
jgi:hypothetical protein